MNPLLRRLDPEYVSAAERAHAFYQAECALLSEGVPGLRIEPIPVQLYHCLPWLFADLFPEAPDEDLCRVAASGLFYFLHVLTLDRAADGDAPPSAEALVAGSLMHERALTLLFPRLPADTPAWDSLARHARRYVRAVLEERMHKGRLSAFPWERFREIGAGKAALLKGSPLMLACMVGRPERAAELDPAIDPFNVALQLQDDLEDWRADLAAGRFSYLLTRALEAAGWDPSSGAPAPGEDEIGHHLFYGGVAAEGLRKAIDECDAAAARAREMGAARWARLPTLLGGRLREVVAGFESLRSRGLAVAAASLPLADAAAAALERLAGRLAEEHDRGYPEARHTMRFAHALGFGGESEVHHGEVFQRGVLGWYFAACARAGRAFPEAVVRGNLRALEQMRRAGEAGGWSYFPTLPDLAPDSDDLAQVIHAFQGENGRREALFAAPVELVLAQHRHPDGSVDTWIVDPAAPPERQARYRDAIERHWGRGVDPEVVANFFAALHAWDPGRYGAHAEAGAAYVAGRQEADGSWASTWYVGPYYGTFTACRLLRAVRPHDPALERARDFLLARRRPDGGWGLAGRSDALSTALAVLSLVEARVPGTEWQAAVESGVRHLVLTQRTDGLWPRTPLIRMDLHRTLPGAGSRYLTYESGTMSGAFAGAALLSALSALEER